MICRPYQFLFVHVPKTAGQSVEQFFMDRLGLDWDRDRAEVEQGLKGQRTVHVASFRARLRTASRAISTPSAPSRGSQLGRTTIRA